LYQRIHEANNTFSLDFFFTRLCPGVFHDKISQLAQTHTGILLKIN